MINFIQEYINKTFYIYGSCIFLQIIEYLSEVNTQLLLIYSKWNRFREKWSLFEYSS